jgi:hypothetical protein
MSQTRRPGTRGFRGSERRATTRVREWLRDRIDPAERGTTAQVTQAGVEWLREDEDLLDAFLYEHLFTLVAEMVRAEMLATRRVRRMKDLLEETDEVQLLRLRQWFDRMEHVSPEVGYVRLGAMTRPDFRQARAERRARVLRDATHDRWYAMLEAGLPDDDTPVEEVYTPAQVEQAYESASQVVLGHLDQIIAGAKEALDRIIRPDNGQPSPVPNNK